MSNATDGAKGFYCEPIHEPNCQNFIASLVAEAIAGANDHRYPGYDGQRVPAISGKSVTVKDGVVIADAQNLAAVS
jgi:hypothetical protein